MRLALGILLALLLAGPAEAATREGYLTMPDGTRLRYTVLLPTAGGRAPTLVTYDGHFAGTRVAEDGIAIDAVRAGYAVVGVNARGTGCSSGSLSAFTPVLGEDGARIVEWAAAQDFSTGDVGMFGFSFAGILQLMTAGERPPHLRAITPGSPVADLYRDLGRPGGIPNPGFASFFDAIIRNESVTAQNAGEAECRLNGVTHEGDGSNLTAFTAATVDDDAAWRSRAPGRNAARIAVPVLLSRSWQDPVLGSRIGDLLEQLPPATTWTVETNGRHGAPVGTQRFGKQLIAFFERFVRGDPAAWQGVPHSEIWHETSAVLAPSWVTTSAERPRPTPLRLFLRAGGVLAREAPGAEAPDDYLGGQPAPSVNLTAGDWDGSSRSADGSEPFTTPPLDRDLSTYGSASLDLWLASSTGEADVQATLTEVRPDGQELFVQRGWLRASRRALDPARSTELRPVQTQQGAAALTPGVPVLARLEVLPFAHVVRRGSSLRVWIESPTGSTGVWRFPDAAQGGTISILHDAAHPSALVLGTTGEAAQGPLPACGNVDAQPCRVNPVPRPGGTLVTPAPAPAPAPAPVTARKPAKLAAACRRTRRVTLRVRAPRGGRLVRVRVATTARTLGTRRGRALRSITVTAPAKRVRLRIRTQDARGRTRTVRRTLAALKTACR